MASSTSANPFDQLGLFGPDAFENPRQAPRPIRARARSYDAAVMRYIGYYRLVTLHQVIYRFFVFAGRGPGYGFRLMQGLVRRGLIESRPLDPELGSISRQVLTLTPAGWQWLGHGVPKEPRRANIQDVQEYRLQFAETMLVRESEGWTLVPEAAAWARIRSWGLHAFRGMAMNDTDRMIRRRIEHMPPMTLGMNILWHRGEKDLRLLLPVRRGRSFTRLIERLPASLGLFPPLGVEMVVAEPTLEPAVRDALDRWSERARLSVTVHTVANFRARAHPLAVPPTGDVYTANGVADPRLLV